MLKRKIYKKLLEWKADANHKPLLIRGPRQVGKTFIVDEFGKNEYKSYIKLNFIENDKLKEIFENGLDSKTILAEISLRLSNVEYIENSTLIFFDEIQMCPKARTALKFLSEDKRYDYIASGSMLGIMYKEKDLSIPVGYEIDLEMYSLDFEEFLWAKGINDSAIETLKDYYRNREKVPTDVNNQYMRYFKEYMVIGGMPEVINNFFVNSNFEVVNKIQDEILKNYRDDIANYAENRLKQKIRACYDSIPAQLSRDHTKFKYSIVESKATFSSLGNAIDWLIDSGLIKKINNVSTAEFPIKGFEKEDEFKLYLTDIGLLTCMFGMNVQKAIMTNEIKTTGKGGLFENAAFVCLMQKIKNIHYYKDKDNTQQIEFLFEKDSEVIPIEVKSKNGATISLNNYIKEHDVSIAYKIIDGNVGYVDKKYSIPYYMLPFIE